MSQQLLFGVSVAFGFLAWGIVAWRYIWPGIADSITARRAHTAAPDSIAFAMSGCHTSCRVLFRRTYPLLSPALRDTVTS
jgi:hypothetical protein